MDAFVGKWKLTESENFDEYLKALGVGLVLRKLANSVKPTLEVTVDGDNVVMTSHSTVKTVKTGPFQLGVEFTNARADGKDVATTISLEDGKIVEKMGGDKPSTITRQIEGNNMLVTCECSGVISRRVLRGLNRSTAVCTYDAHAK